MHKVSFGKQILNYLREILKKCCKFGENFWGILEWLCRSILNIFMKSRKNFKKLLKNDGVNVKLILGKLRGNIRVILYYYGNYKEISKMFLWNFSEIVKKIWRNVGNTSYRFFNILMKILLQFFVNFCKNLRKLIGKLWKILYGFCFLQECSYHSGQHVCAKYFPTSKSANVSVLIGMRRLKSRAMWS